MPSSRTPPSYVVCATPRSGSTLLCEALGATGVAGRPDEYFEALVHSGLPRQPREYFLDLDDPSLGGLLPERAADPGRALPAVPYENYLAGALERGTTPNGVFAAKLMWGYLDDFLARLRDRPGVDGAGSPGTLLAGALGQPRYVHILRRDKVRQAISLWRAIQTSSWRDEGGGGVDGHPLSFRYEAIAHLRGQLAEHERSWSTFFEQEGLVPLTLVYEDFAGDLEGAVRAVLAHVGVPAPAELSVAVPLRRQADELTEAWVERFQVGVPA